MAIECSDVVGIVAVFVFPIAVEPAAAASTALDVRCVADAADATDATDATHATDATDAADDADAAHVPPADGAGSAGSEWLRSDFVKRQRRC